MCKSVHNLQLTIKLDVIFRLLILLAFVFTLSFNVFAQRQTFYYKVLNKVDVAPKFPGGEDSLKNFIFENFNFGLLSAYSINGYIYAKFTISKDGCVSDIKLIKGLDEFLDNEFLRVLSIMPKWIPAKNNGKPVESSVVIGVYLTTDF